MQIGLRALRFQLGINQAAQPDAKCRKIGREQLGVGDQSEVSFQLSGRRIGLNELFNALAAHFFFALKQHADIDGQLAAAGLKQRLVGLHLHPELALVVDGAARIDVLVALGRLPRRSVPLVQRLGRLHIEVRIA